MIICLTCKYCCDSEYCVLCDELITDLVACGMYTEKRRE